MIRMLIAWALNSRFIVVLLALALTGFGVYAFLNVNVEAYPDPAPAIIEIVAQYPGASAEEVERKVTVPLEIALAGMPHLTITRTKSLAGLCHMRNQFEYGVDYLAVRQEILNRLATVQGLPAGVVPQISPATPTGELVRYQLANPKDKWGKPVYTLQDLKALEDWVLEHEFKRLPRIADVDSFGGLVKRYEVRPNPKKLRNTASRCNKSKTPSPTATPTSAPASSVKDATPSTSGFSACSAAVLTRRRAFSEWTIPPRPLAACVKRKPAALRKSATSSWRP